MTTLAYLLPIALFLGGIGLVAFVWALRSGQYEDLDGSAARILIDEPGAGGSGPSVRPDPDRPSRQ